MQFTFEVENNNSLSLLDVLLIKKANTIITKIYRKLMITDICLNWSSHAPATWKGKTLRITLNRAYTICSTENYLQEEIKFRVNF